MNITILTNNKAIEKIFTAQKLPKDHAILVQPTTDLKKIIADINPHLLYYIDLSSMDSGNVKKTLQQLEKHKNLRWGIIDPKGVVQDIAGLFHHGALDYIGKGVIKEGLKAKRLLQALEYHCEQPQIEETTPVRQKSKPDYIISGNNWKEIKSGHEYTFTMMFIELDNIKWIKQTYGMQQFNKLTETFHTILEKTVEPVGGKVWMWMDHGGLVLFPFDGKTCDAIIPAFRLMLNRMLICVEKCECDFEFTYRIAIHIGNTMYKKRGATGDIISDSINSIFHLGQKFAEPMNLYLTEDAVSFVPQGLTDFFIPAGDYEGREHYRLKTLSH